MSLMNISGAGIFSADRAITEYAENIWHTKPVAFPQEKSAPAPKKEAAAKSLRQKRRRLKNRQRPLNKINAKICKQELRLLLVF